jgi:hypothetical protein
VEAGASLATGTKRTSALALAAISHRTVRHGRKEKDVLVWTEWRKRVLTPTKRAEGRTNGGAGSGWDGDRLKRQ